MQSQAWLRLQCLFKLLLWPMRLCEFLLRFREDRRLGLTNKTLECLLRIKTEGTDPVLHDSSKGSGGANAKSWANANHHLLTC